MQNAAAIRNGCFQFNPLTPLKQTDKMPCSSSKLHPRTSRAGEHEYFTTGSQTFADNCKFCILNSTLAFEEGCCSENKLSSSSTEVYFCCSIFHLVLSKMLHCSY